MTKGEKSISLSTTPTIDVSFRISLQALMYAITYNDENAMLKPSLLWKKLRTTKSGETSMKGIMYQLISSLEELHKEGIVHRDVKPSNVLLNTDLVPKLLVADFSSGWQSSQYFEAQLLYSSRGPSTDEESLTYAPPEVLLALSEEGGGIAMKLVCYLYLLSFSRRVHPLRCPKTGVV